MPLFVAGRSPSVKREVSASVKKKVPGWSGTLEEAGDRLRTGDFDLGKVAL